jgi:PAS domain S-box-containing protein
LDDRSNHPVLLFECTIDSDGAISCSGVVGGLLDALGIAADDAAARLPFCIAPEDTGRLKSALALSAREATPFTIDLHFPLATGQACCLETHVAPVRAADGAPSWRAAAVDVTEQRRSQQLLSLLHDVSVAISDSPDYQTAVAKTLHYMCRVAGAPYGEAWLPDPTESHLVLGPVHREEDGGWTAFEAGSRAISYTMDVGAIGLSWRTRRALWADDVRGLVEDSPLRPALPARAGRLSVYAQPICADDSALGIFVFYLEKLALSGITNSFATVTAQLGTALQRRRIEQELEYANIIVEQSPTVVYRALATEGAPRVYTSRNVTRFGYSVEDCKRGRFNFPGFVHEEDRPRVLDVVQRMLADDGDVFEQEYRLVTANGEIRYVHDRTVAIRDAGRQITHWQGALTDITERWLSQERLAASNRQLERLSLQLSKYLSPQIYRSIFSGEQAAEISTQRKKLTIFFSDIADFTQTTDSLESEELTGLLNHYLTEMSKIALEHGATIDKYIGDAILAFFGDPESRGAREDALACVRMAIAMQRRMRELQEEWRDIGSARPFQLRIGINTGFCTVGNFGSVDRMDYTVIGSEVNLAARLQSHAELGGILLGHETHALVRGEVAAEELPAITVKGFAAPVAVYRVLDVAADADAEAVRYRRPGARIDIDLGALSAATRREVAALVEDLRSRLRDKA